jgi:hypothetical protein
MNFGLIVEGEFDSRVYQALIRNIRSDVERIFPRVAGGRKRVQTKFPFFLDEFMRNKGRPVDKVMVIHDSDDKDPAVLEQKHREAWDKTRIKPPFPVHFHATKCEVEAWLLADENAVNEVARARGGNPIATRQDIQLEAHPDPKSLFRTVLYECDLQATAEVYAEVASAADLDTIQNRCPRFGRFVEGVNNC